MRERPGAAGRNPGSASEAAADAAWLRRQDRRRRRRVGRGMGPGATPAARLGAALCSAHHDAIASLNRIAAALRAEAADGVLAPAAKRYSDAVARINASGGAAVEAALQGDRAVGAAWVEVEKVVAVGRGSAGDGRGGVARRPALPSHASDSKSGSPSGVCDPWLAEARFAAACRIALAARRACLTRLGRLFDESVMAERRRAKALGTGAEIVAEALAVLGGSGVTGETADGKASVTASKQSRSLLNVQSAASGLCRGSDALRPKLERRVRPMLGALLSAAGQSRRAEARAAGTSVTSAGDAGGRGADGSEVSPPAHASTDVRPAALGFGDDGTDLWADEDLTRSGPPAEPLPGSAGEHHARPSALSFVSMAPADVPRPIDSPQVVRWGSVLVRSSGFMKKWQPGIAVVTSMGWLHLWSGGASEAELGSNRDDVARQVTRHGSHVPAEPRRAAWAQGGGTTTAAAASAAAGSSAAAGDAAGSGGETADASGPTSAMGVPAVFPAGKSFSGLADITDESLESLVTGSLPLVEPWRSIDLVTCAPGSAAAERDDDMAAAAASAVKRQAPSGRGGETVEVAAGRSGAEGHGAWVVRLRRPGLFGTSVETITLRCRPGRADGTGAEATSASGASTSPPAGAAGGDSSSAAAEEEQTSAALAEGWIRDCWAAAHAARSFE